MDIAMTSMLLSQTNVMTTVNTAVLGMNLDSVESMGNSLVKMMEQSVNPELGQTVDIKV